MVFMDYLGDSLLGVKTLLLDLATISNFPWGYTILVLCVVIVKPQAIDGEKEPLNTFFGGQLSLFRINFPNLF